MKGKLILQRERDFGDFFRKYRVYINGHERGRISRGGTFECELEPGAHTMNLKIDWCGSNSVSFVVNPDEAVGATCGSNLRGWRRLKAAQLMLDPLTVGYGLASVPEASIKELPTSLLAS